MLDVALLCPVNPFQPLDGHRLAVASDVNAILDNGLRLGVLTFLYDEQKPTPVDHCDVRYFTVAKGSFATRLLRGLVGRIPPSSERLYTRQSIAGVRHALHEWKPDFAIVDDVSMAGYIPHIREIAPKARIILRSHNVMRDVRREQLERTTGPTRIAVKLDSDRYHAFERASLASADCHWAITQSDADRMTEIYGVTSGFLSVSIPMERYAKISVDEGRRNHFIHVGTLDFRRRADLESFLQSSWPKVRAVDAEAAITFAGSLHGKSIDAPGVSYAGRVDDDAQIYRKGRFALNLQQSTGGVKLKTLTSLAAGRTLISTQHGIEGVPITSGEHYWDMGTFLSGRLKDVLADTEGLRRIANTGRAWVEAHHSRKTIAAQFANLLQTA
jgi:hypothetical protein